MTKKRPNQPLLPECPPSHGHRPMRDGSAHIVKVTTVAVAVAVFAALAVQAETPRQARGEAAVKQQGRASEAVWRQAPGPRQHDAPATASQCAATKLAASGTYVDEVLECSAKAVAKGGSPSRACLRKAEAKLTGVFAEQERTGACATVAEATAFRAVVDPAVADLVTAVGRSEHSACARQKLRGAGESAKAKYGCQADAVSQGAGFSIEPACWAHAEEEMAEVFFQAERKGDCAARTGDAQVIDNKIDALVLRARGVISPAVSACSPVEVTTLHGDNFHGNSRLAKIENGTVPCMHVEDGTVASCLFSVASGQASGEWLESPEGNFARTGQALSPDGVPGGDYVVAARVSDAAGALCLEPTSLDTQGRIASGTELPGSCVVEDVLMEYNAYSVYGFPQLVNYADGEVCSANDPAGRRHPDDAFFVRTVTGSDGNVAYCYSGYGAALNDVNGMERDETTTYLTGEAYCHLIVSGGYEVPGAKRPATRSLPAPGSVVTNSFIVWRPVNPNVNIANFLPPLPPSPPPQSYDDKAAFLAETGAEDASGALPDLGDTVSAQVGSVTFELAPGGNGFAIGAAGTSAAPDWYPATPGNDIAMGYESLQVSFSTPVYAMGFDLVEPNLTMPAYGGTPVDSTYQVTLFSGTALVGRFNFNAPDDVLAFVGVRSAAAFDRATIIDVTKDASGDPSPFIDDDEYFGQFYTAATPSGALSGPRNRDQER